MRKRMTRVERQRRENGEDDILEIIVHPFFLCFGQFAIIEDMDAGLIEFRPDFLEKALLGVGIKFERGLPDGRQFIRRNHPIRRGFHNVRLHLFEDA